MASETTRELHRPVEARDYAERAVELDPEHGGWRVTYGLALQQLGLHRDAVRAFDEATRLDSELTGVHAHRATSLSALGKGEEGMVAARKYAELRPDDSAALLQVVNTALAVQDLAAVRAAAYDFAKRFPDQVVDLRRRADEIEEEAPEQADAILHGVIEAKPDDPDALRQRGILRLYDMDDYEGALGDFRAALAILGGEAKKIEALRLHHLIAESLWALDRYEDAVESYRAAFPDESDPAMRAEIQLRLAESLIALGRTEEAQRHLTEFWTHRSVYMDEIGDEERLEWARQQLER
jgi:tetratricopeptide (TPR) repeat protein